MSTFQESTFKNMILKIQIDAFTCIFTVFHLYLLKMFFRLRMKCECSKKVFLAQPPLLELEAPINICGKTKLILKKNKIITFSSFCKRKYGSSGGVLVPMPGWSGLRGDVATGRFPFWRAFGSPGAVPSF